MAPATESKAAFTFTAEHTIGDLILAAAVLEKAGHRPSLRFVRYYGVAESVAVDVEGSAPSGEMAVTEGPEMGVEGDEPFVPVGASLEEMRRILAEAPESQPETRNVAYWPTPRPGLEKEARS